MADAMERHTPVIILTHEERQRLRDAWERTKDLMPLIALQNDDELRHLQDVTADVKTVRQMGEEGRRRSAGFISIFIWFKDVLSHAAKEVSKIRIE